MRPFLVLTPALVGLALSACDGEPTVRITTREETASSGQPIRAVENLNCPEHQGELIRTSTAADGLSCIYAGPRGAEVVLSLVALAEGQSAMDALSPTEDALRGLMPGVADRATGGEDGEGAMVSIQSEGDQTSVRLPGLNIETDGDSSSVNIGGIRIRGRGSDGESRDSGETVSVNARDDAAEIRAMTIQDSIRATYILVDEAASEAGWRRVGYEARGPSSGPLVVAVVHSKEHNEGELFDDAEALVTLNVGGSL